VPWASDLHPEFGYIGSGQRRLRKLVVMLAFALGLVAGVSGFAVLMTPSEPDPLQAMALAPGDASVAPLSLHRRRWKRLRPGRLRHRPKCNEGVERMSRPAGDACSASHAGHGRSVRSTSGRPSPELRLVTLPALMFFPSRPSIPWPRNLPPSRSSIRWRRNVPPCPMRPSRLLPSKHSRSHDRTPHLPRSLLPSLRESAPSLRRDMTEAKEDWRAVKSIGTRAAIATRITSQVMLAPGEPRACRVFLPAPLSVPDTRRLVLNPICPCAMLGWGWGKSGGCYGLARRGSQDNPGGRSHK